MSLVVWTGCIFAPASPPPRTTVVTTTVPAAPTAQAHGTLLQVSGSQLSLAQGGAHLTLDVTDSTVVTLNGAHSSVGALHPGADVQASYVFINGRQVALRVDAVSMH